MRNLAFPGIEKKKCVMTRIDPVTNYSLKEAPDEKDDVMLNMYVTTDLKNSVDGIGKKKWCVLIRFSSE